MTVRTITRMLFSHDSASIGVVRAAVVVASARFLDVQSEQRSAVRSKVLTNLQSTRWGKRVTPFQLFATKYEMGYTSHAFSALGACEVKGRCLRVRIHCCCCT